MKKPWTKCGQQKDADTHYRPPLFHTTPRSHSPAKGFIFYLNNMENIKKTVPITSQKYTESEKGFLLFKRESLLRYKLSCRKRFPHAEILGLYTVYVH